MSLFTLYSLSLSTLTLNIVTKDLSSNKHIKKGIVTIQPSIFTALSFVNIGFHSFESE